MAPPEMITSYLARKLLPAIVLTPSALFPDIKTRATGELTLIVRFGGAFSRYAAAVVREPSYMQAAPNPMPVVRIHSKYRYSILSRSLRESFPNLMRKS
jgi:hypothetical protein